MKFILCIGIPGSGKSTCIANNFPTANVISPDHYIGYTKESPWTFDSAKNAWKTADRLLDEALKRGDELIIFDATFPKAKKRKKYIDKGIKNGFEVVALFCPIPLKISLARNEMRDKFRAVPKATILDMNKRLEEPTLEEGFTEILIWNSVSNNFVEKE